MATKILGLTTPARDFACETSDIGGFHAELKASSGRVGDRVWQGGAK